MNEIITLEVVTSPISIRSNFDLFAKMTREHLASFKTDLVTDEDFDQAAEDIKQLKNAAAKLREVRADELAKSGDFAALMEGLETLAGEVDKVRRTQEKQIVTRRDAVRKSIIDEALAGLPIAAHIARREFTAVLEGAAKGKRTLQTTRESVDLMAATIRRNLAAASEVITQAIVAHGPELVPDAEELAAKGAMVADGEIARRLQAREDNARRKAEAAARVLDPVTAQVEAQAAMMFGPPKSLQVHHPVTFAPVPTPDPATTPDPAAETESEEWARVKATIRAAFAPIKSARQSIKFDANEIRMAIFADAVGAAWKEASK